VAAKVTRGAPPPDVPEQEEGPALVPTGAPGEFLPATANGPDAFGWWGMLGLITTEALLFSGLIASYFYLRFRAGPHNWPPRGIAPPDLVLPLIMTVILWSSSIPVHYADRAIRRGNQRGLRLGLFAGFLLGATFLAIQLAVEWPQTLKLFKPQTNAYGSLFFTLTGFHGFHVFVGLAISVFIQVRAGQGAFDRHRHLMVQNFAMYWHFVDAVWALILFTVYLSPRW
jgi:heme/copper-type cytochrome/quinol oxidase subunit 3